MLDTATADMASQTVRPFEVDLGAIRFLAGLIPGALPIALNGIKVAASVRPRKFVIEGGDESKVMMPRTAFQVVYPDGTIMIDSGLDRQTHDSFGGDEPYFPENFARLQRALDAARLIVLTHFHADHVAGVVRAANFDALARKTIVTADTVDFLVNRPHRPHLKITDQAASRFVVLSYRKYHPVAPGLVLIKAPGHSPDMQMAFIRLRSGQEFLHCIDAAWNMDNIRQVKGKAAPWVKEDVPAVMGQLQWLNDTMKREPELTILITHDDDLFDSVTSTGSVGSDLAL